MLRGMREQGAGDYGVGSWIERRARSRLADHQVPASITFVTALPRNAVGKLVRHDLARLAVGGGAKRPTIPGR
jgi:acyl-coenzyme A synthetase/AMP-(fatty) acid ligase